MVPAARTAATITVRFRTAPHVDATSVALTNADPNALAAARPWREFRWHAGQKHYSGTYWSATEAQHVVYESRLELARLLFADFDRSVRRICAQPFLLVWECDGARAKHIPDYLLLTDQGPKVVDVKPARRLSKPEVASTFAWTRSALERRAWLYEVWSEPDEVELQNVRFLASFRRRCLFDQSLLEALRTVIHDGDSISKVVGVLSDWPSPLTRAALFNLMWSQEFTTDMRHPLSPNATLTRER